jgi:hypothetical protein
MVVVSSSGSPLRGGGGGGGPFRGGRAGFAGHYGHKVSPFQSGCSRTDTPSIETCSFQQGRLRHHY